MALNILEDMGLPSWSCKVDDQPLIRREPRRLPMMTAAFAALIYIIVLGMVTSYSAPATPDMLLPGSRFRHISPDQITWIASLPSLTGVFGNALSGYVSHRLGRKAVLMYVSIPYTVSWLMIAYAPHISLVYAGRLLSGFSAGFCSVAVPAYVVEISTVKDRGLLTSGFQVAFAFGVVLVMAIGAILRWSWLAFSGALTLTVGACLLLPMPESPLWLARKGKNSEALKGLKFLRGKHHDSMKELEQIKEHLTEEPSSGSSWREILDPLLYKPVTIALALMFFQQFSGINSLMSYAVELFKETKISLDASVASIIVAIVQLFGTIVSSLLMDKAGRKALYIVSGSCMTMCLIALGVYSYCSQNYTTAELSHWSLIPLISFTLYIAAFSLGVGPIPFVLVPELVPTRLRSFLLAVSAVSCSLFGFVITKVFDDMRNQIGLSGVYWTYSVFAFLGVVFYWVFIPETKGKTIHEIHRSFSRDLTNSRKKSNE